MSSYYYWERKKGAEERVGELEMAKRKEWESDSESESESESEEEEKVRNGKGLSKYEEQRVERIGENRARLESMGITQMASSLKLKKKEVKEEDEEYIPEDDTEGEPGSTSSTEQHELDFDLENPSHSRKRKVKKTQCVKMKGRVSGKKHQTYHDDHDDDKALRQAIALSLQHHPNSTKAVKQDKGTNKNSKSFTSRLQMTEDEFILHFFQLDEAGKGNVTKRDLERAALAHDFVWTDKELADMIRCFDTDRDGKLSLDDFRKIVVRCNMIKESESS